MDYSVEADWQLLNTCNFRCAYCLSPNHLLGEKLRIQASPAQWEAALDATGRTWLLHLTGGEPGLYPGFEALCRTLTGRHYISVNSNLTHPSWRAFAERIDPARVSFINAGLHLEERESRAATEAFLRNAERLRLAGFPIMVSLVATPIALERFDEAIALVASAGQFPIPKLLRERHEGRRYPDAYSDAEKTRFRDLAASARAFYERAPQHPAPTINMFDDDAFLDGVPPYTGRSCAAGSRFVRIEPNGDVFRCSTKTALGNLLEGSFTPMARPAACDTGYCFYWCEKYAAPRRPSKPGWTSDLGRRLSIFGRRREAVDGA